MWWPNSETRHNKYTLCLEDIENDRKSNTLKNECIASASTKLLKQFKCNICEGSWKKKKDIFWQKQDSKYNYKAQKNLDIDPM